MKNINFDTPVEVPGRVLPGNAAAFRLNERRGDVEFRGQHAGDLAGPFLRKIQVVRVRADIIGKTNHLYPGYTRSCQEAAVTEQGIRILHQVFVEIELDVVDDDGVGL